MIRSKIDWSAIVLLVLGLVAGAAIIFLAVSDWMKVEPEFSLLARVFSLVSGLVVLSFIMAFVLPKAEAVEIGERELVFQHILTRRKSLLATNDIDGFKAKGNSRLIYEIHIIVDGIIAHQLSSNFIKNYDEVRTELEKRLTVLETDDWDRMRAAVKQFRTRRKRGRERHNLD
jgi:hypothetical protein